jgi:hypothetical protein
MRQCLSGRSHDPDAELKARYEAFRKAALGRSEAKAAKKEEARVRLEELEEKARLDEVKKEQLRKENEVLKGRSQW